MHYKKSHRSYIAAAPPKIRATKGIASIRTYSLVEKSDDVGPIQHDRVRQSSLHAGETRVTSGELRILAESVSLQAGISQIC